MHASAAGRLIYEPHLSGAADWMSAESEGRSARQAAQAMCRQHGGRQLSAAERQTRQPLGLGGSCKVGAK